MTTRHGTTPPGLLLGDVGDLYIDTVALVVYTKTDFTTWLSLGSLTAGGGGASSIQIDIPFTDQTALNGAAGRAGATNVKAVLTKVGNQVTMCIQAFSLDNSTHKFDNLNTDWDFDPVLYPSEFPIPADYRPSEDQHAIMPIISIGADKFTQGLALIGKLGHIEIVPVNYASANGYWSDFSATATIHTNGYATYLTWLTAPAFV